jgi:hypothetical protein
MAPVLGDPRPGEKFVDTNTSNVGIGGVLSQVQDRSVRVVAYFSKTLSKVERNYSVTPFISRLMHKYTNLDVRIYVV